MTIPRNSELLNGQAVQYLIKDSDNSIKGLTPGTVYYVQVDNTVETETRIRFFGNKAAVPKQINTFSKANALKLELPSETGSGHYLTEVVGVSGNKGADTLVASLDNSASALLGGDGKDLLIGSNGSDYLDGGDDSDILYGDGSHADSDAAGLDIVRGGGGADFVFGYADTDYLYGESGNDYLVGGSGSDVVDGVQASIPSPSSNLVTWVITIS